MKLVVTLFILTALYFFGMCFLVREYRTCKTKEERTQNQSIPLMFAATILFLVVSIHTTTLAIAGTLPLLG